METVPTILKDNTEHTSTADNIDEYLSLQNCANKEISKLLDENGNSLLIYPHSFFQCEDEVDKQVLFSMQTSWKDNKCIEVKLRTGNLAGFISINGFSVSINSRFAKNKEDFFLHYMLQKVLCINVVNMMHGTANEQIFNFLLFLFPKFLNEALAQGIYKEYQRKEYNDANIRGTIDINRHLKTNLPFNGRIAYRTREFSYDNHITELIRHTIDYINKTATGKTLLDNNAETRTSVAQIISATPSYNRQERERVIKSNLKITSHPYYSRYAPLQKLCLRILRHEKIKYGANDNKIYGVLFDVSYLWEEYLSTILTNLKFKHPNNRKGTGRIYLAKQNKLPRYPDFYREEDHCIIDAKYKREHKEESTRDDVNQMITYMYRLKGKTGVFILPSDKEHKICNYDLLGYGTDNNAKLQKYFFPISQTASDYKNFSTEMEQSEDMLKKQFQAIISK